MDQRSALWITDTGAARDAREWLYKADHPRRIDQYIDFFGTGAPRRETADCSRELVLELLA
jgi:hypothetical protein